MEIAVALRYRDPDGLRDLVEAQADPSSPQFGRFLTSAEFAERFAPSRTDQDRVVLALRRAGFSVTTTFANRTVVMAEAPAPIAARALATEIHEFDQPGLGRRYGNVSPAKVPDDIADIVAGVAGLSDIRAFATDHRYGAARIASAADLAAASPRLFGPDGGYGPGIYANAYSLLGTKGFDGAGRAGAVVIDADFLDTDIASYLSYFAIKRTGRIGRVKVAGGPPAGLSLDSDEATLDVETMAAAAPGASITVYEGRDFSNPANLVVTYNQLVSDNAVDEVNASLGYCETAFGNVPTMIEHVAIQGSALGITFHASTGDNGASVFGCNSGVNVAVPAAAPHVVAVGGTSLEVDFQTGRETKELAWITFNDGATGGGVSKVFPRPSFQSGSPGVTGSGRNLPDVAFSADPALGTSFYFNGQFAGPLGGTSLASPIFGGAVLQLDQLNGKRAGWITPLIYSTWRRVGYGTVAKPYFRDIVKGEVGNSIAPGDNVARGYDRTTGIGAVLFGNTRAAPASLIGLPG